jgi:alkanesulfonate monooxygenase SsuD/methylene tetrahydromethanopterin reductase-like flavin-dependent oxidoreductase (luciferase family)
MKYALELPNMLAPQLLAEMASAAEEAGWNGIFLEDYIVHWSAKNAPTYDPWVALAAMATKTKTIRLGTTVTPISRRRPWKLAREAVTLDHLSNGRLILGVGLGDPNDAGFGPVGDVVDIKQRAAMADEALTIMVGLWSGQPFSFQGAHYQLQEVTFLPTPVQQPRIPIWIGGSLPHKGPIKRAARWDGMLPYKKTGDGSWQDMTPAEVSALRSEIEQQRTTAAPFDLVIGGRQRAADWEKERALIRSLAEAGLTWWGEYIEPEQLVDIPACLVYIRQGPLFI